MRLNITNANYILFNPDSLKRLSLADKGGIPRKKGTFFRIGIFFYHFIKNLKPREWQQLKQVNPRSTIFFTSSKNQKVSLLPIFEQSKNSYLIGDTTDYPFSAVYFKAYALSLPFFPIVLLRYLTAKGSDKEGYQYAFDTCWLAYGFYIMGRRWLKEISPAALILANDHNMEQRILMRAAKAENIPTVYIQHASVTSEYPVLSFDYALLEGFDALNTYHQIGKSDTEVYLVGSPKFDSYYHSINQHTTVSTIGICTNWVEPLERAEELCNVLSARFPEKRIILRPHPADKRVDDWKQMALRHEIEFSNSNLKDAFQFLCNIDLLFAGNSSIHLEAALLNVYPIYYNFTFHPRMATYSYLETGLCEYFDDPEMVCKKIETLIKQKPDVRIKAQHYCATVATEYDGNSSELANKVIAEIARDGTINLASWNLVQNVNLVAYEPNSHSAEKQKMLIQ